MAQIVWTEAALQDLEAIADYIALMNSEAAGRLVNDVLSSIRILDDYPLSGRFSPELDSHIYKELIVNPCHIFYRIEDNKVIIIHIMRAERGLRKFLLENR